MSPVKTEERRGFTQKKDKRDLGIGGNGTGRDNGDKKEKCNNYGTCYQLCAKYHHDNKYPPGYIKAKLSSKDESEMKNKCAKQKNRAHCHESFHRWYECRAEIEANYGIVMDQKPKRSGKTSSDSEAMIALIILVAFAILVYFCCFGEASKGSGTCECPKNSAKKSKSGSLKSALKNKNKNKEKEKLDSAALDRLAVKNAGSQCKKTAMMTH